VANVVKADRVPEQISVIQGKTKRPVQFELTQNARDCALAWAKTPEMYRRDFLLPSQFHDRPHISTRQYGRFVRKCVTSIEHEPSGHGTHALRRTKVLGHTGKLAI